MNERTHAYAAYILAGTGVILVLTAGIAQLVGAIRHIPIEVPHVVLYIGAVVGFVGFYGLDPKRAKDAGAFIVDSGVRIIGVIRSGRRSTDAVAVVVPDVIPEKEIPPTDHGPG